MRGSDIQWFIMWQHSAGLVAQKLLGECFQCSKASPRDHFYHFLEGHSRLGSAFKSRWGHGFGPQLIFPPSPVAALTKMYTYTCRKGKIAHARFLGSVCKAHNCRQRPVHNLGQCRWLLSVYSRDLLFSPQLRKAWMAGGIMANQ